MRCATGPTDWQTDAIFNKIGSVMAKNEIPWSNCVGFSLDNTRANLSALNSVKTTVLANNEVCQFSCCSCHIIRNTAPKVSIAFTKVTGFDMEDFCIDLYYYFDKSSNRKGALKEYAQFCDREYRQIRYVNVRWLSLEKVAD